MSYEYNAHDDFPIPHPDWSGYLAPRADEEFALAPTNLTPQATNYQGHAHGYSDTAPTQNATAQNTALADEAWLTEWLSEEVVDQALPSSQTMASESPKNHNNEQVVGPQIPWIPMSDEQCRSLIAQAPLDLLAHQPAFMPLDQDQITVEPMYPNFGQEQKQLSQDLQAYHSFTSVAPVVQPELRGYLQEVSDAPTSSPKKRSVGPSSEVIQKRRSRLPPVDARPQPVWPQPASWPRTSRQAEKAARSKHYRDHVYKDYIRSGTSTTVFPSPISSGRNSADSTPSTLILASPFPSYRASPVSDTSVESNGSPAPDCSKPIPGPCPVPSQGLAPPMFIPAIHYANLPREKWAETFFQQPQAVRDRAGQTMPAKHARLCCAWIIPQTWMSCHMMPSGQPKEYLKAVSGRTKNGFFARTIEEFLRHLLAHRRAEAVLIEMFGLGEEYQSWWNNEAIDAQAVLDKNFPKSQKWLEGEKRPF